jgi:hypothetical protein
MQGRKKKMNRGSAENVEVRWEIIGERKGQLIEAR